MTTFKEAFDRALVNTNGNYNGMQEARGAFERSLRKELETNFNRSKFGNVAVIGGYLNKGNPIVSAYINITTWYRPTIIEFKIKTKRGAKHYWQNWYEYSVVDYRIESINSVDMKDNTAVKKAFEEDDITDFLNNLYDNNMIIQNQIATKANQDNFINTVISNNQAVVDTLINAITAFKDADISDEDRDIIRNYIYLKTDNRLKNF